MSKNKDSIVCLVADGKYLYKNFPRIYKELRTTGNYKNEILVITSYFTPTYLIKNLRKKNKVTTLRFKKIKFDKKTDKSLSTLNVDHNRHVAKNFQWHKLYLFHKKIKKWKYIFYIDINMTIHHDINPILSIVPKNELLARADGYPDYKWKLESQFDKLHPKFNELKNEVNLDNKDYFQTGLLYYDTNIVKDKTFKEILLLISKYPLSITNEQGILNLYFTLKQKKYTQLVDFVDGKLSYFYWMINKQDIIITKALTEKNK